MWGPGAKQYMHMLRGGGGLLGGYATWVCVVPRNDAKVGGGGRGVAMAVRWPVARLNWRALRGASLELSWGEVPVRAWLNESCSALRVSDSEMPELGVQLTRAIRPTLGQLVAAEAHLNTHSLGRPASDRDTLRK